MLIKNEFLAEESIEQPDHEEYIGRICGMNYIKAMAEQYFKTQPERHEYCYTVFRDVSNMFVRASRHSVLVNVNALNANVRLLVPLGPLRADDTNLKAIITEGSGLSPDTVITRGSAIFYQH